MRECLKPGAAASTPLIVSFSLSFALVLPDTIRKMKNDFRKMEDEMDRLATNMAVITDFSARISATLQDRHERITKLAGGPRPRAGAKVGRPWGCGAKTTCPRPPGVHALLRKLQFLFELPSRLTKCVELGAYGQAVRYQGRARAVLQQYQHLPSFRAIQDDCQVITARLAQQLRQRFRCGPGPASHSAGLLGLPRAFQSPPSPARIPFSCPSLPSSSPQGGRLGRPRAGGVCGAAAGSR